MKLSTGTTKILNILLRNKFSCLIVVCLGWLVYSVLKGIPKQKTFDQYALVIVLLMLVLFISKIPKYKNGIYIKFILSFIISNIINFRVFIFELNELGQFHIIAFNFLANLFWISIFRTFRNKEEKIRSLTVTDFLIFILFPMVFFIVGIWGTTQYFRDFSLLFYIIVLFYMFYLGLSISENDFTSKNILNISLGLVVILHLLYGSTLFFEEDIMVEQLSYSFSHISFLFMYWFVTREIDFLNNLKHSEN